LSLAETVVADEELMAVVEPVLPHSSVDEIRSEIEQAKAAAESDEDEEDGEFEFDDASDDVEVSLDDEFDEGDEEDELPEVEPTPPPSPEEVRAGFARIAARLAGSGV
jgi:hypothetical protein